VGGKLLIWNKGNNDLCVVYAGECGMLHVCTVVLVRAY